MEVSPSLMFLHSVKFNTYVNTFLYCVVVVVYVGMSIADIREEYRDTHLWFPCFCSLETLFHLPLPGWAHCISYFRI